MGAALALLSACSPQHAPPPVMRCPTVPPLRRDWAPAPPRPAGQAALILTPGHWDWADGEYTWVPPQWRPRSQGRQWQDGFWTASGIACGWTPGRLVF